VSWWQHFIIQKEGDLKMSKKKFRLTIDIRTIIPDKIPTKLVENVVNDVDRANSIPLYQPKTEKHQAVIDFIKNNESIHEQCIAADLYFKLSHDGLENELPQILNPRTFDEIVLDASKEMDIETKDFLALLYDETVGKEDDDTIDEDGNPLPQRMSKKQALEAIKREIDRRIIQDSLLDYKVTGASLKLVKNVSQTVK
jgi:hypothetical protein